MYRVDVLGKAVEPWLLLGSDWVVGAEVGGCVAWLVGPAGMDVVCASVVCALVALCTVVDTVALVTTILFEVLCDSEAVGIVVSDCAYAMSCRKAPNTMIVHVMVIFRFSAFSLFSNSLAWETWIRRSVPLFVLSLYQDFFFSFTAGMFLSESQEESFCLLCSFSAALPHPEGPGIWGAKFWCVSLAARIVKC